MPSIKIWMSFAVVVAAAGLSNPAGAGFNCLSGQTPFRLGSDVVTWSIKIQPGRDCIQGLRWSTMQIDKVSIVSEPKAGRVVLVGPGFRYFSNTESNVSDSFEVAVTGTNVKSYGKSIIKVEVSAP